MPNCSAMSATAWMMTAGHNELVLRTSQPKPSPHQEGDRHERGLRPAVADREVGEPEHRGLADVGPPRAHGALQGSEQQSSELHLLRERLQRVCRTEEREIATDGDRLQGHPAEHPGGEREPESDEEDGSEHPCRKTAPPEASHAQQRAPFGANALPCRERDEHRAGGLSERRPEHLGVEAARARSEQVEQDPGAG